MKNNCPYKKCNKIVEYDGKNIVGIKINNELLAVHKNCFHNIAIGKAFDNVSEGRNSWDDGN